MSDPYRRVRPGEAVRVSATAWNALMDLVRPSGGVAGGGSVDSSFPTLVCTLRKSYYVEDRPLVLGEAVIVRRRDAITGAETPTLPLAAGMTFSAVERRLFGGFRPSFETMYPSGATQPAADDCFAICLDPRKMRFAVAGVAWTRVRQVRSWHRFARRCLTQPGDGATEAAKSIGTLDSCAWGPAEILGWAPAGFTPSSVAATLATSIDAPAWTWALVRF